MVGEFLNIWVIYLAASLALLVVSWRVSRDWLSTRLRSIFALGLLVIFCTPAAVPDTQVLAPAWLVAIFEALLGKPDTAQSAIVPVIFMLLLVYLPFLAFSLARRRRHH